MRRETGLMVVIPKSYEIRQVPDLLEMKRGWILGKFVKYAEVQRLSANQELKSGDSIPYLGRNLKVVKEQNNGNANSVKLEQNKLLVSLKSASSRLNVTLERWYRMQAVKLIGKRASELSPLLGLTYNRLVIRGQRTRWGSCSHKGNLSFNWKLLMAPEPVIDYVIIHELAHLKEMNHTKRFWELVAEYCPRWREHKKWLKDHETELATKLLYSFI
ncbi:MAG: M48 family peptidase [Chloroflexi bacterium CG_4_8_14_3_um_filter_45_15]|nr:MAG: M48 family peptidase [Chloroflexi bacterium CG_4_8_14_3_um_filter_45_15]